MCIKYKKKQANTPILLFWGVFYFLKKEGWAMIFYHVSPTKGIDRVKLTKYHPTAGWYSCLSSCIEQAYYWVGILGKSRNIKKWYIHEVSVPDNDLVFDCIGHYFFESQKERTLRAIKSLAKNVVPHTEYDEAFCPDQLYFIDGEVAITKEYPVVKLVEIRKKENNKWIKTLPCQANRHRKSMVTTGGYKRL